MSKKIDYAIWGVCALFLILAIVVVATFNGKLGQSQYETYTVQPKEERYYSGMVAPDQKESVSPKALEKETMTSQPMKSGQKVTKGQTLFTFSKDMSSQISAVNADIQQLTASNASLQSQQSAATTTTTDSTDGSDASALMAATPTVDNSAQIAQNNAQIASDQSKLAELNEEANRTVVAPISGTLIKDTEGNYFVYGKPIVQGNVNEFELPNIKNNADMQIYKNNGKKMYGTVTQIDKAPYNSSSSVSYYHFQVTADQNLTFGMHVQIKGNSKGFKIPKNAVTDDDYVQVLKSDNTKKKVYLTLDKSGDFYYTHSGIKAGQKLVLK